MKNKVDCSKIGNSWKKLSKTWTYTPKCANISHMCCEMLIQEGFIKKQQFGIGKYKKKFQEIWGKKNLLKKITVFLNQRPPNFKIHVF